MLQVGSRAGRHIRGKDEIAKRRDAAEGGNIGGAPAGGGVAGERAAAGVQCGQYNFIRAVIEFDVAGSIDDQVPHGLVPARADRDRNIAHLGPRGGIHPQPRVVQRGDGADQDVAVGIGVADDEHRAVHAQIAGRRAGNDRGASAVEDRVIDGGNGERGRGLVGENRDRGGDRRFAGVGAGERNDEWQSNVGVGTRHTRRRAAANFSEGGSDDIDGEGFVVDNRDEITSDEESGAGASCDDEDVCVGVENRVIDRVDWERHGCLARRNQDRDRYADAGRISGKEIDEQILGKIGAGARQYTRQGVGSLVLGHHAARDINVQRRGNRLLTKIDSTDGRILG